MAKAIAYSEAPEFNITSEPPGQIGKKYYVKSSFEKFAGADEAVASGTLGEASDVRTINFPPDAPEAPTELNFTGDNTGKLDGVWVQKVGKYPAVSWVLFLGNDMKNPIAYVEDKKISMTKAEWAGTTQEFSVGAFPMKTTGTPEEQLKKAVESGRMSPLSAPVSVEFKSE